MNPSKILFLLTSFLLTMFPLRSQDCNLSNYTTATLIGPAAFPYFSAGSGITVSAATFNVPTLGNFSYTCNTQTFNCSNPAWWHQYATGWIQLTFSAPVYKFTMALNGSNTGEVFTFVPNTGGVTLSDYCTTFTATGNQLTCNGSLGTIVSINHPTGATQFTIYHNGTGSGSRMTLLDCFLTTPPLPIELTTFSGEATGGYNTLSWETQSEVNNEFFQLERSYDAVGFEPIAVIPGQGNSNVPVNYQTTDNRPYSLTYYRLKQVDINGDFEYYGPITVENTSAGGFQVGNVFPNPVDERINLNMVSDEEESVSIAVINEIGKPIYSVRINLSGSYTHSIDCSSWSPGIYNISVSLFGSGITKTQKVVVQ